MADFGKLDDDGFEDDDDDDDDLEAELMALQAGQDIRKVISRHRLVTEGMPKIRADASSEDDEDIDLADPDLLAELQRIEKEPDVSSSRTRRSNACLPAAPSMPSPLPPKVVVQPLLSGPVDAIQPKENQPFADTVRSATPYSLLQERIEMYRAAQSSAKAAGETAKSRRLERGLKTLEAMLKSEKAGNSINEEDIPPPVTVGSLKSPEFPSSIITAPEVKCDTRLPVDKMSSSRVSDATGVTMQPSSAPPLPPRARPAPSPPSAPTPAPASMSTKIADSPVSPTSIPVNEQTTDQKAINSSTAADQRAMQLLLSRRGEYRKAALAAKRENDRETTLQYVKIAKLFDGVISAMEAGEAVDLSDMPPPPPTYSNSTASSKIQETIIEDDHVHVGKEGVYGVEDSGDVFNAPPAPTSILDSLEQRLQKYRSATREAQTSDNASKARRMGRIVKQYEDAIKAYKAGKAINFEELPTPPGFAPIPIDSVQSTTKHVASPVAPTTLPAGSAAVTQLSRPLQQPSSNPVQQPPSRVAPPPPPPPPPPPSGSTATPSPPPARTGSLQRSPQALHEKQHAALVERQDLFKVAALEAKRRGDIQAAKEYLKLAKGFEPMIKASLCGLPVNMDSVPLPPQKTQEATFELVTHEDCEPIGDRDELFEKLDKELIAQIEMCANNRSHFTKIGDVQSKKKFETLLLDSKKDLDFVRHANKGGYPVPRFHYETKTFSIVRCFTDLGDDDIELSIIRGINYACPNPNEVDTYVRFEFPYPEILQKDKTHVVKDTNNPEYNAVFKLLMNRKSRNLSRVIKRQAFKFEIMAKGGFLRSDTLLGTAVVKLAPLETRCTIHDTFDLMEGRKPVGGGKLEVQIRIRDPILNKQVETLCEKWLVVSGGHATQL